MEEGSFIHWIWNRISFEFSSATADADLIFVSWDLWRVAETVSYFLLSLRSRLTKLFKYFFVLARPSQDAFLLPLKT